MRFILDASIALKWVLEEPDSIPAMHVRDEAAAGRYDLLAPDVFPFEIAYALTKAERRRAVKVGEAEEMASDVFADMPELYPATDLLFAAIRLSSQLRTGLYDCLYLVLAEQEGVPLLTADVKLVVAARSRFPVITLDELG
jgi:predicted nucleic acid-binding protein